MRRFRIHDPRRRKTWFESADLEAVDRYWDEHHRPGWVIETKDAEDVLPGWRAAAPLTLERYRARYRAARAAASPPAAPERPHGGQA